jgi:uncharacterized protein YecT (DUF1311 family)
MMVSMKNDAGLVRQVKVGFSWTALFFGALPFFFRGMPATGFLWCCLPIIGNFILPFKMNKYTAHYYLEHGYKPSGTGWQKAGLAWGIEAPSIANQNGMPDQPSADFGPDAPSSAIRPWHIGLALLLGVSLLVGLFGKHDKPIQESSATNSSAQTQQASPTPESTPIPVSPSLNQPKQAESINPQESETAKVNAISSSDVASAAPISIPSAVTNQPVASANPPTWAPSFDCAKASNGPERLICSNAELSDADVKLGRAYKLALQAASDNGSALKKSQNEWRKTERDACSNVDCMLKAYHKRIDELAL